MPQSRRAVKKHRLLVYQRMGQRMRTMPFFLTLLILVLLGIGWLGSRNFLPQSNQMLLSLLWERRLFLFLAAGASVLMYLVSLIVSRGSFVEARPKTLRVKAGIIPVDISYARIRQIRLVTFNMQYNVEQLNGRDFSLIEGHESATCTALDLKSLPKPFTPALLRRMWHRFMFTGTGDSFMFVVDDPMVLNQQIDSFISARQARFKKNAKYLDPIERAAQEQASRKAKATKAEQDRLKKQGSSPQINLGRKR